MRVPLSWLKDFVKINITPEELARKLTFAGLEVEEIEYVGLPLPAPGIVGPILRTRLVKNWLKGPKAEALLKQFPGCPLKDAHEIAAHACQKYSGRVGRSAAARQFDPTAIRLAVIAYVRHTYTKYDRLLARHGDRHLARSEVQGRIEQVLTRWEGLSQSREQEEEQR